ncbi:hypothetical protein GUJ93_ZPchr0009g1160 [Zizania palustris]|uniref:Uncharacterized protein n=1 Tax=Zizania palustris TaxID=103762 RepID=A0A8J5V5P2_ZIZPA|nr:hypothetical protein GUJ93_ZPchr0009g1160 [Zizania palustris]
MVGDQLRATGKGEGGSAIGGGWLRAAGLWSAGTPNDRALSGGGSGRWGSGQRGLREVGAPNGRAPGGGGFGWKVLRAAAGHLQAGVRASSGGGLWGVGLRVVH